jgi:hypothetical protein
MAAIMPYTKMARIAAGMRRPLDTGWDIEGLSYQKIALRWRKASPVHVAAALRAGAAVTHGTHLFKAGLSE